MRDTVIALAALYNKRDNIDRDIANLEATLRDNREPKVPVFRRVDALDNVEPEEDLAYAAPDGHLLPVYEGTWEAKITGYMKDHGHKAQVSDLVDFFNASGEQIGSALQYLKKKNVVHNRVGEYGVWRLGPWKPGRGKKLPRNPPPPPAAQAAPRLEPVTELPKIGPHESKMQETARVAVAYIIEQKGGPVHWKDLAAYVSAQTGRKHSYGMLYANLRASGVSITSDGEGNWRLSPTPMTTFGCTDVANKLLAAK